MKDEKQTAIAIAKLVEAINNENFCDPCVETLNEEEITISWNTDYSGSGESKIETFDALALSDAISLELRFESGGIMVIVSAEIN